MAWQAFASAVSSAHRADERGYVEALRELTPRLDLARRAGMFVWFALRYQVVKLLDEIPNEDDLRQMATEATPRMSVLPKVQELVVVDALLTVFELVPPERRVVGGDLIVIGTALLGALVSSADSELSAIHTDMAEWYVQKKRLVGLD